MSANKIADTAVPSGVKSPIVVIGEVLDDVVQVPVNPAHVSDQAHTDHPVQPDRLKGRPNMAKDHVLGSMEDPQAEVLRILLAKRERRGVVNFVRRREVELAETVAAQKARLTANPVQEDIAHLFGVSTTSLYRDLGMLAMGREYGENVFSYKDNAFENRMAYAKQLTSSGVALTRGSHPMNADEIATAGINLSQHRHMRLAIMSNMDKACADAVVAACCATSPVARVVGSTEYHYFPDFTVDRSYQLALITLAHNYLNGTSIWPCVWIEKPSSEKKKQPRPAAAARQPKKQQEVRLAVEPKKAARKNAFNATGFDIVVEPVSPVRPKRRFEAPDNGGFTNDIALMRMKIQLMELEQKARVTKGSAQ